jgi:hypothetical protein
LPKLIAKLQIIRNKYMAPTPPVSNVEVIWLNYRIRTHICLHWLPLCLWHWYHLSKNGFWFYSLISKISNHCYECIFIYSRLQKLACTWNTLIHHVFEPAHVCPCIYRYMLKELHMNI